MSKYKKWERPPKIKTEGVITTCIAVPTSRYIDADALKQNFNTVFYSQITKTIDSAPSIDIVFCHECKFENTQKCPPHRMGLIHDETDYCSYGIRRADDDRI